MDQRCRCGSGLRFDLCCDEPKFVRRKPPFLLRHAETILALGIVLAVAVCFLVYR